MPTRPLVLASSSPYRRMLLERLGLPFECASPDIDETPLADEPPAQLATRLAESKARALSGHYRHHWIIGSDQTAALPDGTLLSKPGSHERAMEQLTRSSGQRITFYTGLALYDSADGTMTSVCETFSANFRTLTDEEIHHYLVREHPYDCAGSFKMEGLGISLFTALEGRDPNTLVGLPLIALNDMLREWGLNPLTYNG